MPYLPGYMKSDIVRVLSPYMGDTFETLDEAKAYVKDEELDKYMQIKYYHISEVKADNG